jgi:Ras-related protein Rab-11A
MSYDYLFKYIFVGETGAGKTSFANRLVDNDFSYLYESTIGVDFRCKMKTLDNNTVIKSHIWDTAGQEKFTSIITNYYKGIAGAIIVFDVTKRASFDRVEFWRKEIAKYRNSTDPMVILIVANKIDRLDRVISTREAREYALKHNFLFAESSCKDNINVEEAFEWLIIETYEQMDKENPGCGIRRSPAWEEAQRYAKSLTKPRDCCYLGDKYPNNKCCIIV